MARKIHFSKNISLKKFFRLCLFSFIIFLPKNYLHSKPLEDLEKYSNSISLAILTPASSGSGFIIGKKKNVYFFLTAAHVAVSDPSNEEYWVYSQKNSQKKYRVLDFKKPSEFRDKDIVIGTFTSNEEFDVPLIFPLGEDLAFKVIKCIKPYKNCLKPTYFTYEIYQNYYGDKFDYAWLIQGKPTLFGFSIPTQAINIPLFRSSKIDMKDQLFGNQRGYEAIYEVNTTVPGMSGGPILGNRVCPTLTWQNIPSEYMESGQYKEIKKLPLKYGSLNELNETSIESRFKSGLYPGIIAMHGMSEEYAQTGSRSGIGLGIPLTLLKDFFNKNAEKYGIISGREYFEKVHYLCSKNSYYSSQQNDLLIPRFKEREPSFTDCMRNPYYGFKRPEFCDNYRF